MQPLTSGIQNENNLAKMFPNTIAVMDLFEISLITGTRSKLQ